MKTNIYWILLTSFIVTALNLFGSDPPGYNNSVYSFQNNVDLLNIFDGSKTNPARYLPPQNSSISYTSKAIYFNITPSSTAIYNKGIYDDENWNITNGIGVNFEIGYLSKFNKIFGFGFGLGNSSYTTELTSSSLAYSSDDTDIDYDDYVKETTISEISEKILINYFDIPIFLEFSNTNIDKIGFYGRVGVKVSFPFSKSLTSGGYATYEGYYPQYDVLLYDIPELGFETKPIYTNTEITINPVNISGFVSVGATYPLSNILIIKLGVNANFGLMEISKEKADDYENTKYDGNYNKLLGNPNAKTTTRSFGIEIGLIYNLKFY